MIIIPFKNLRHKFNAQNRAKIFSKEYLMIGLKIICYRVPIDVIIRCR